MANFYSPNAGVAPQGVSINDNRRIFNFGERVSELAPQQSPFFVYLSKVAKKATDDPVFKFMEQRHQWQRRNMKVVDSYTVALDAGTPPTVNDGGADAFLALECYYDKYGNISATGQQPLFLKGGDVIAIACSDGVVRRVKIKGDSVIDNATDATESNILFWDDADGTYTQGVDFVGDNWPTDGTDVTFSAGANAQVIGSAFAEGSTAPTGWEDALYDREGYCQIFKTAMNLFSGTAMATKYRGIADEYKRVWTEKLMEHKMDLEQAFLFGIGSANGGAAGGTADEQGVTTGPIRYTHGILPYAESFGKVYNMSYASSGYDAFLDAMEDYFAPESGNSGNKLVLASRKVITYLNKLGSGSFLNNSVGASQYSLDVANVPGAFGHQVTVVNTIYGNLHFVQEPLLRGPWENYAVCVDMANIAYRPLAGNGISRDTFIETNIQANDEDGRRDQIITEAGLEISLPETHAILKFS
tara:strand:- start:7841 stop:9256 length:1416 start_codon:yes stop_codon:yes gene_type:complete